MMNPVTGEHLMGNPCVCQTCTQARDDARATSFRDGQDRVYAQRNMLVGALSKLFPAWISADTDEPDWPVVLIELPTGQVSFHVTQTERYSVFAHLMEHSPSDLLGWAWDGHDDAEKWRRVCTLNQGTP